MVVLPIAPLIDTTFPEISKAVAQSRWPQLRSLLTRTSLISLVYTLAVAAGFILVAPFFLRIYGNGEYLPALPLILVLLLGYGFANVFFWNRPLLLAFGKPNSPLWITAAAGAVKTALMFVLVRPFGYLAQAGLLSAYFIFSIAAIVWRGLKELKQKEKTGPTPPVPAGGDEEKPEPLLSQ
jgi:O-antigen/teichoic acid export membrane protein